MPVGDTQFTSASAFGEASGCDLDEPYKDSIQCDDIDDAHMAADEWQDVPFHLKDGRELPFDVQVNVFYVDPSNLDLPLASGQRSLHKKVVVCYWRRHFRLACCSGRRNGTIQPVVIRDLQFVDHDRGTFVCSCSQLFFCHRWPAELCKSCVWSIRGFSDRLVIHLCTCNCGGSQHQFTGDVPRLVLGTFGQRHNSSTDSHSGFGIPCCGKRHWRSARYVGRLRTDTTQADSFEFVGAGWAE